MIDRARTLARDPRVQFLAMTVFLVAATWAIDDFLDPYREKPVHRIPPEAFLVNRTIPDVFVTLTSGAPAPHPITFGAPVDAATFLGFHLNLNATLLRAPSLTLTEVNGTFRQGTGEGTAFGAPRMQLMAAGGYDAVEVRSPRLHLATSDPLRVANGTAHLDATTAGTRLTHEGITFRNVAVTLYDHAGMPYSTFRGIVTLSPGTVGLGGPVDVTPKDAALRFGHQKGRLELDPVATLASEASLQVEATLRGVPYPVNATAQFDFARVQGSLQFARGNLTFEGAIDQWLEPGRARIPAIVSLEVLPLLGVRRDAEGEWAVPAAEGGTTAMVLKVKEVSGIGSAVALNLTTLDEDASVASVSWHLTAEAAAAGTDAVAAPKVIPPHGAYFLRLALEAPPGDVRILASALNASPTAAALTITA